MADKVNGSDVNAKFKRRGRDQHLDLAVFQFFLCRQPQLARQAAMVGCDIFFAETLAELVRNALGHPPRIHEHQSRAMLVYQLDDAFVDFVPHLVGGDRP